MSLQLLTYGFSKVIIRTCTFSIVLVAECLMLAASNAHASASATDPGFIYSAEQTGPCPLVLLNVPDEEAKEFEREFPKYLVEMTGREFPVTRALNDDPAKSPSIVLELMPSDPTRPKAILRDQFRIRTDKGRIVISSFTTRGLHYGFYDLMEKFGCRFWSFSEQEIPKPGKLQLLGMDYAWESPFVIHDIMSKEAQTAENDFRFKSRATSPIEFTGAHTLYTLLTPYAKEHPDIYPLVQDKNPVTQQVIKEERKANDLHFCYSAPGIAEALATSLEGEVEKRKGNLERFIYFAGMGDWYGGQCQCERCKAIYAEETWTNPDGTVLPGYSATLLRMINQTAEILDKKYPGILVGTFAYMSLEAPPAKTRPRDNVVIYVPRLRHCGVHPADQCSKNRQYWLSLQRWSELAPGRLYVWEYGTNFTNFLYPFPTLAAISENIASYHKLGIAGVMIQGNYVSTGGDMVVLNNYVYARMFRDPSQNVRTLINDSIAGYYGPASSAVMEYLNRLEKLAAHFHLNEFSEAARYLTPEVRLSLKESLSQAKKLVAAPENQIYAHRIAELAVGIEAAELWSQGPLVEKDGYLIRKDLQENTYPRAVQLAANNRNSTPREYGTGREYWLNFLKWHGGPLKTIAAGSLIVKAAPAQNLGAGPVLLNQKALLSKTWFPTILHGELADGNSDDIIRMTGESGIEAWSPNTKYVVTQEVRIIEPNTVEVTASVERRIEEASTSFEIRTLYPDSNAEFRYRLLDGTWKTAAKPSKENPLQTGEIDAWKVISVAGEVTDIYEALAKPSGDQPASGKSQDQSQKPAPFTGVVGIDPETNKIYTSIVIPAADIPKDAALPWLRRTIAVAPIKR